MPGITISPPTNTNGQGQTNPKPPTVYANPSGAGPAGYSWDQNSGAYVPTIGSATDSLAQRARQQGMEDTRFQQGTEAFGSTESALNSLLNSWNTFGASGAGLGGSAPSVASPAAAFFTPPGGGGPSINTPHVGSVSAPSIQPVLDAAGASQNAAFGKAKATAGSLGQAALGGLRASLAGRGIAGSGVESRGLVDQLAAATNPLSDINAAGLHENVGIAQHGADQALQAGLASYQGDITQRGQDLNQNNESANRALQAATTGYQGGISQRGQDIGVAETNAQLAEQRAQLQAQLALQGRYQTQEGIQAALSNLSKLY